MRLQMQLCIRATATWELSQISKVFASLFQVGSYSLRTNTVQFGPTVNQPKIALAAKFNLV